jgi:CBS domain-containing protein
MTIQEAGSTRLVVTHPDELVSDAASKMLRYDIGRLPAVDHADGHHSVLGYLGRSGVMAARLRRFQDEHLREPGWFLRKAGLDVSGLK